jgi:hypothetical protein
MNNGGLAYDQAPPFIAPLTLYLAAPAFLLVAALAGMVLLPDWLDSRWNPATLGLTHLITLGFLGLSMCASLLQMLPVVIGAPVPAVRWVASITLIGLGLGTPALTWGLWQSDPAWLDVAIVLLPLGFTVFIGAVMLSLWHARSWVLLRVPLLFSAIALLLTLLLGIALTGTLGGHWVVPDMTDFTHLHLAWGLMGWTLVLVIGVSWQVVPMLQLTPTYPIRPGYTIVGVLFIALCLLTLGWLPPLATLLCCGAALAYALITQQLYRERRRKLSDATLNFWRVAMANLILSAALLALRQTAPQDWHDTLDLLLGLSFLLGFAASVVCGMAYKIVPFLCWFHLQAQHTARKNAGESITNTQPGMKAFISDLAARQQFQTWGIALAMLLPAPLLPPAASTPGLVMLALSALQLWRNLWHAARRFRQEGGSLF